MNNESFNWSVKTKTSFEIILIYCELWVLLISCDAYQEGKPLVLDVVRRVERQLLNDMLVSDSLNFLFAHLYGWFFPQSLYEFLFCIVLRSRNKEYIPIVGLADFNKLSAKLIFGADRLIIETSCYYINFSCSINNFLFANILVSQFLTVLLPTFLNIALLFKRTGLPLFKGYLVLVR